MKIHGKNPFFQGWLEAYLGLERDPKQISEAYKDGFETLLESTTATLLNARFAMYKSIENGQIIVDRD